MTDEIKKQSTDKNPENLTRRDFTTILVGAGLAATVYPAMAAELELLESDVEIKTPDGTCDAFHSSKEGFASRGVGLARRTRLTALDARNWQAYCR